VLPYPVGAAYEVIQSYCSQGSHRDRFAWDFLMLFGDEVVAARDGVVDTVVEQYADDDKDRYHNNHIFVRQDDGTRALYAHFQQDGIWVQVGDRILQGQVVGAIGESGTPTPCPFRECGILHFSVYPRAGDLELPLSFRNAGGQFDSRGGLRTGATYEALPY
jgi:murein DD-endopeptidase MepM/ murein hydrolase activator NlpD